MRKRRRKWRRRKEVIFTKIFDNISSTKIS
jgi:hypothetical protein